MTPHRRRQQQELSLYQRVCMSTAQVEGHKPGLLPGPLVVPFPTIHYSKRELPMATKKCQHFMLKYLPVKVERKMF